MHNALREYLEIRQANQLGLPVAQVKTVNRLERNADEGEPFEVETAGDRLEVTVTQNGWTFYGSVRPDGSINWRGI